MIVKLTESPRFKKDLSKFKSYLNKCNENQKPKLELLIETYEDFAKEIDANHDSRLGGFIRPVMARDARYELAKLREKLDKFVSSLDN